LKEALLKRKESIELDKRFFGKQYDTAWDGYVFTDEKGTILSPDYLTQTFGDLLKKHGLKHIRLHDLRHSCASLLLANGVNLKMIQEWLGHADFSTTANVYSHLDFSNKVESADILSKALGFEGKPPLPKPNEIETAKKHIYGEMKRLGLQTIGEYVTYWKEQETAIAAAWKAEQEGNPACQNDTETVM
jgi:hypothetical protein